MSADGKFKDLTARTLSAIVMIVVGVTAIWAGGLWFLALCAAIAGLIAWELARMVSPDNRMEVPLGIVSAAAVFAAAFAPIGVAVPGLLIPAIAGGILLSRHKALYVAYAILALLASFGLFILRDAYGLVWVGWLIAVVVMSDVAGYFAGRILGGPKFWPTVSPKKTWSGTVAGWIGAFMIGLVVMQMTGAGPVLLILSVLMSFAGQMGDIAESAIKRKMGVKDSSNLIPGHGGVMDRFDAMLGASVFLFVVEFLIVFPPTGAAP